MNDPTLAVRDALDAMGKTVSFLEPVFTANPQLRGADVADVLSMAIDGDHAIEWTEPAWDIGWPQEFVEAGYAPDLVSACVTAAAMLRGGIPNSTETAVLLGAAFMAANRMAADDVPTM